MIKITKLDQIQEINFQSNTLCYLYGKTGSGKTYLSKQLAKQTQKEVLYTDFGQIMQDISDKQYKNKMENTMIVIDDEIKQLQGKEMVSFQIEKMIKEIQNRGISIIILSSLTPKELKAITPSLAEFILSGIQMELCYDVETKIQIAEEYSKKYQMKMQKELLQSIVKKEKDLGKIRGMIAQMSIHYE